MWKKIKKTDWAALPIIVLILGLELTLVFSVHFPPFQTSVTAIEDGEETACGKPGDPVCSPPGWITAHHVTIEAVAAAVTGIFTVALAVSTYYLWDATRKSVRIAERALTELEAPAVFVEIITSGIALANVFPDDQEVYNDWGERDVARAREGFGLGTLQYVFVNYGRTPAHIIAVENKVSAVEALREMPEAISLPDGEGAPWGVVIPPDGGKSRVYTLRITRAIFEQEPDRLYDVEGTALFFSVILRYADIFGDRYRLGACFKLNWRENRVAAEWILADPSFPFSYRIKEESKEQDPEGPARQIAF